MIYIFSTEREGQFNSTTSKAVLRGLIEYYWQAIMSGVVQVMAVEV